MKESISLPSEDQQWGSLKDSIEESRKKGYSKLGNILLVLLDYEVQGDVVEMTLSDGGTSCIGVMPVRFIQRVGTKEVTGKLDEEISSANFGGFYRLIGQHSEYEFRELVGREGRQWQSEKSLTQRGPTQGCSMLVDSQKREACRPKLRKGVVLQLSGGTLTNYQKLCHSSVLLIHEQSLEQVFSP